MIRFFKRPFVWAITSALLLTSAFTYTLLDALVIPQRQAGEKAQLEKISQEKGAFTDSSYQDDHVKITIMTETSSNTKIYLADVQVSDVKYLKTALAENTFGRNIKQTTSEIAEKNGAVLAINGDFYGFRNDGIILRNGKLYRNEPSDREALIVKKDGTFETTEEQSVKQKTLRSDDVWQVFSFGPALIRNSAVTVSQNSEVEMAKRSNPRTAIGMVSPLHYIFMVSDGRTEESEGLTLQQVADILKSKGCVSAYNLDGGGSTTMWFHGKVINNPTDGRGTGERKVSDIVYIG